MRCAISRACCPRSSSSRAAAANARGTQTVREEAEAEAEALEWGGAALRRCTWRREQDGVVGIGPVEMRAREEGEQHAPRQLVSFDELQRLVEVIVEGVLP